MFRGYRGAILTSGLVFLGLAVIGATGWLIKDGIQLEQSYRETAAYKAERYTNRASEIVEKRCVRLSSEAKRNCVEEIEQATRENEREERDLEAQLITAAWTAFMGAAALIGMAVSVIGVGLVFITFRETRKATIAAQHGAAHALASLHANRAWITPDGYATYEIKDSKINGILHKETFAISLKWKNTGGSPAINSTCFSCYAVVGNGAGVPHFDNFGDGGGISGILGINNGFSGVEMILSEDEWQRVSTHAADWYCYSIVSYRDIYNPSIVRESEGCFHMMYRGKVGGPNGEPPRHHFTASVSGPQNRVN
jgi:hypothetical protein